MGLGPAKALGSALAEAHRRGSAERNADKYFAADGSLLFSSFVAASPGDGGLSFLGIVLDDARIARVRIQTGAVPGADDTPKSDVAMMDDFIYGEPQPLP